MTCERHARRRDLQRKYRLDPAYREKELQQQRAYRVSERGRAARRAQYEALDGYAYNELLLRHRRTKALARMAKRHAPKEKEA